MSKKRTLPRFIARILLAVALLVIVASVFEVVRIAQNTRKPVVSVRGVACDASAEELRQHLQTAPTLPEGFPLQSPTIIGWGNTNTFTSWGLFLPEYRSQEYVEVTFKMPEGKTRKYGFVQQVDGPAWFSTDTPAPNMDVTVKVKGQEIAVDRLQLWLESGIANANIVVESHAGGCQKVGIVAAAAGFDISRWNVPAIVLANSGENNKVAYSYIRSFPSFEAMTEVEPVRVDFLMDGILITMSPDGEFLSVFALNEYTMVLPEQ